MNNKPIPFKSKIFSADKDEMHDGWIRISEDLRGNINSGVYVQVKANNQTIYCQVRGTPKEFGIVRMNEWYRTLLGWPGDNPPTEEIEFTIQETGLRGKMKALTTHPSDITRVSFGLGLISISLGLLSVLQASFLPRITTVEIPKVPLTIAIIIDIVVLPLFLFFAGFGWRMLFYNPSKHPKTK